MNPRLIAMGEMIIAGVSAEGDNAGTAWAEFEALSAAQPLKSKLNDDGYELRRYTAERMCVHVGCAVPAGSDAPGYAIASLPPSEYAVFEVDVSGGYDSGNAAMDEWLRTNEQGYTERTFDGINCCIEHYDERFHGNEPGSIVEFFIPVEKQNG